MTNHSNRNPYLIRLAPLAAAAALLATACGSSTTTSKTEPQLPSPAVAADDAALDIEAPTETTPPVTELITTDPAIDETESAAPTPSEPEPDSEPEPSPDAGTPTTPQPLVSCGNFGAIPPTPDSMPTLMYDTDGDGNVDDKVTAYSGGGEGWVLRVVEDGVISEAHTPGIDGWAYISNDYEVDGRDYIEVTDRRGERHAFPIVSFSMGVVTNQNRAIASEWEASAIASEMKEFAKRQPGSTYSVDRRQ